MAQTGLLTLDHLNIIEVDSNPSVIGSGIDSPLASVALYDDPSVIKSGFWMKMGSNDTDWTNIETTPKNVIHVKKNPAEGEFSSIADAADSITDSSETNTYLINVGPGIYTERLIDLPNYVYVRGSTIYNTVVEPDAANHHIIDIGNSGEISFLTIQSSGSGYAAVTSSKTSALGDFVQLHKISIYNCDIGILVDASARNMELYAEYVDINETYTTGVKVISANGYTAKVNLENFYTFPDTSGTTVDQIKIEGSNTELAMSVCNILGNGLDTGILVTDGVHIDASDSYVTNCNKGLWAKNVGVAPTLHTNVTFKDNITDILIEHPNTSGSIRGSIDMNKVTIDPASPISMSYVSPNDGQITIKSIYQGDRNDRLLNLSGLVRLATTLGLESGGLLTTVSGRTVDVSSGTGFLLDPTDAYIKTISWSGTTVTIPANEDHYIFVNTNGSVTTSQSPQNLQQVILLGRAYADPTDLDFIENSKMRLPHYSNLNETYLREAIGAIFGTGGMVSENVSTPRALDVTAGKYFFGNNAFTISGGTAVEFETYYRAISGWNSEEAQTVVDNLKYDNGSGTLANLTAVAQVVTVTPDVSNQIVQHYIQTINGTAYDFTSDATPTPAEVVTGLTALINGDTGCLVIASGSTTLILTAKTSGIAFTHSESANLAAEETTPNSSYYAKHSLYVIGDAGNEKFFFVYSQAQYATLIEAQEANIPTPPSHIKDAVVLIAVIITRKSATHIEQIDDERPRIGFKPASLSVITSHGDLQGLLSDDHKQYLLIDGTRAMTGNLDMGGGNVTNVNLVDGVDVSAHESRHLPNGLDPLDTAAPTNNLTALTTNASGIQNSFSRSDHSHAITTDLAVTQTPDQTNASGSSAGLARADHVHNIPTAIATGLTTSSSNTQGSSSSFARADHTHLMPTAVPLSIGSANALGTSASFARADHIHQGVYNVGLSAPVEFSVSGSPVTTTGTLTITKVSQSANTVWAGPTTGAATLPTFRSLVAGDIPLLSHGSLLGLSADDHLQYFLLGGRSGGQVARGGTAASETLTLMSTANATKGKILFGTSGYDEVNNRLGIGTTFPNTGIQVGALSNTNTDAILVGGAAGPAYMLNTPGTYMGVMYSNASDKINFGFTTTITTPSASVLSILQTNKVGIGTSTPTSMLSVGSSSQFQVDSAGNAIKINNVTYSWPAAQGSASTSLKNDGSGNLSWSILDSASITTGPATTQTPDQSNAVGTSASLARSDHVHNIPTAAPITSLSATTTNASGTAASFSHSDHTHAIISGAAVSQTPDQSNAIGTSASMARSDHVHNVPTAAATGLTTTSSNTQGSAATFARSDHTHNMPTATPVAVGAANALGSSASFSRADHVHQAIGTGLYIKSGIVLPTAFSGDPKKATVTFSSAFPSNSYSVTITAASDKRTWTYESRAAGNFVINANANGALTAEVSWQAITIGESN